MANVLPLEQAVGNRVGAVPHRAENPPWSPRGSTRSSFWGGEAGWGADVPTSTSPTPQCGYGLILPSEPKRVLLAAAGGRRESSWVSSASAGIARASKGTAGSPFPGGQKLLIPTVGSRATYCPQPPCGPAAPCPIGARAPGVFPHRCSQRGQERITPLPGPLACGQKGDGNIR